MKLFQQTTNDKTAKYYDIVYRDIKGEDVISEEIKLINSLIDKNSRILDVGCGTGRHFVELLKQGNRITGIDTSKGMLEVLKSKIEKIENKNNFVVFNNNFFEFDFKEDKFDLVILMWNVLFEMILTKKALKAFFSIIQQILNEQGKVLINIDNTELIKPEEINSKLRTVTGGKKYESSYSVKSFDRKRNIIELQESISTYNERGELIDEQEEFIQQRWWSLKQITKEAELAGLMVKVYKIELNDELYIVLKRVN